MTDKNNLYTSYYGLAFECPMGKQVSTCAFAEIRKCSKFEDRLKYIRSLSHEEFAQLIKKHQKCLAKREQKIPYSRIAVL
jgi:hypothetical protein